MKKTEQSALTVAPTMDDQEQGNPLSAAGVAVGVFHQALLTGAPVTIYYMTPDGTIRYANPAFRRIFGLRPEQGVEEWRSGLHADDRAAVERHWDDFNRNPRPCHVQFRAQDSSGVVRHLIETVVAA